MPYYIAGIDVDKKLLAVAVADVAARAWSHAWPQDNPLVSY